MALTSSVQEAGLKQFEPTWVVYDPADPYGLFLAFCTLSPVYITVMHTTLVFFQRDIDSAFLLVGQLLNEVLNQVLKRTIRQKRPAGARLGGTGMPSAHSQFMGFFTIYTLLYTWKRFPHGRKGEKLFLIVSSFLLTAVVCISRVWLGYHTREQVLVGVSIGSATGCLWALLGAKGSNLSVTAVQLLPRFSPWFAQTRLAQAFHVRDISHVSDLIAHQHATTCAARSTDKKDL